MTRRAAKAASDPAPRSFRAKLATVSARLVAERKVAPPRLEMGSPARAFRIPAGHERVVVAQRRPDGTRVDAAEAAALLEDRPYSHLLEYRGNARGLHVFSYDPRRLRL